MKQALLQKKWQLLHKKLNSQKFIFGQTAPRKNPSVSAICTLMIGFAIRFHLDVTVSYNVSVSDKLDGEKTSKFAWPKHKNKDNRIFSLRYNVFTDSLKIYTSTSNNKI